MNKNIDRRMIALTAVIMAVLMLATPFAGLASDAAEPSSYTDKNKVGGTFESGNFKYEITEIATWDDVYGYYSGAGKVKITETVGITDQTSLLVPTEVTYKIGTGEFGDINAKYNVTAIDNISLGGVNALLVDGGTTTDVNESLTVVKSYGTDWAYLIINDPSKGSAEKYGILKDVPVNVSDYEDRYPNGKFYADINGGTPETGFTMATEDVNWYYLNNDGLPYAFYIEVGDIKDWYYNVPANGLAATALKNIADDISGDNQIDESTGWITTINGTSSSGTYGQAGYKGFGLYYLDDEGKWIYSNGLNSGESRTYALIYGEYYTSAPETGNYFLSYGSYIPMPGSDVLTNGLANAATVNGSPGSDVTIKYTPTTVESAASIMIDLYYDSDILTFKEASLLTGGMLEINEPTATSGSTKIVHLTTASSKLGSTVNGIITATFTISSEYSGGDITIYSITTEIGNGELGTSGGPVVSNMITKNPEVASGDAIEANLSCDEDGIIEIEYDPSVMTFVSATHSISIVESRLVVSGENVGVVSILTDGSASEVKFTVNENPRVGSTTITSNGVDISYNIRGTSFVIIPAPSEGATTVSLYDVPEIAGLEMKFKYTGTSIPVVNKANTLAEGAFSVNVDTSGKTISIVWADTKNVDLNGEILTISDITGLNIVPNDIMMMTADLKSVFADVSDEKPNVDVAGSSNKRDLNGDGNVELSDLIVLMQYLTNYDVDIANNGNADADFNNDGKITIRDAMNLSKYLSEHA